MCSTQYITFHLRTSYVQNTWEYSKLIGPILLGDLYTVKNVLNDLNLKISIFFIKKNLLQSKSDLYYVCPTLIFEKFRCLPFLITIIKMRPFFKKKKQIWRLPIWDAFFLNEVLSLRTLYTHIIVASKIGFQVKLSFDFLQWKKTVLFEHTLEAYTLSVCLFK